MFEKLSRLIFVRALNIPGGHVILMGTLTQYPTNGADQRNVICKWLCQMSSLSIQHLPIVHKTQTHKSQFQTHIKNKWKWQISQYGVGLTLMICKKSVWVYHKYLESNQAIHNKLCWMFLY